MSFEDECNLYDDIPLYCKSNENLLAIVAGLNLKNEQSKVLSICGSADQAFLLNCFFSEVKAVDILEKQVEFAKKRINYFKKGDFEKFNYSEIGHYDFPRNEHNRNRIMKWVYHKLKQKEMRVEFEMVDIFEEVENNGNGYNLIYFSNCFMENYEGFTSKLERLGEFIKDECLLYFSNSLGYENYRDFNSRKFKLREDLVKRIRRYEKKNYCWNPVVFERV